MNLAATDSSTKFAVALTDSGGSINTSYAYEPFGNVTIWPLVLEGSDGSRKDFRCWRGLTIGPAHRAHDGWRLPAHEIERTVAAAAQQLLRCPSCGLETTAPVELVLEQPLCLSKT